MFLKCRNSFHCTHTLLMGAPPKLFIVYKSRLCLVLETSWWSQEPTFRDLSWAANPVLFRDLETHWFEFPILVPCINSNKKNSKNKMVKLIACMRTSVCEYTAYTEAKWQFGCWFSFFTLFKTNFSFLWFSASLAGLQVSRDSPISASYIFIGAIVLLLYTIASGFFGCWVLNSGPYACLLWI